MNVSIDDLKYYFDSQEKDSMDVSSRSHRSREVLVLRDKLLALSDRDFDAAMKTFKSILQSGGQQDSSGKALQQPEAKDAQALYESSINKS